MPLVILLHGIGHSALNMAGLARALKQAGYDTLNMTYPSLRHDIPTLAAHLHTRLQREKIWDYPGPVHFVTHSMGGLVTHRYLADYRAAIPAHKLGHLVMIAPPHGGSEVADFFKDFPPYKWLFGPAGQQLTTSARATDQSAPYYKLGIIAGNCGWPYLLAGRLIREPHDGRVGLSKTHLPGMADHITIFATHSLISWKKQTYQQVKHFLSHGKFNHDGAYKAPEKKTGKGPNPPACGV